MVGVDHWMLLLLLSVIVCILPAPAQEAAAYRLKEGKQSSSQLHLGKAQAVTLSVSMSRLVGKASV